MKKSKFIANSFNIENKDEAKLKIKETKEKFRGAKHNVYAFSLLNGLSRSSDDREPRGTGGVQILNAINEAKITNVLIVVTRYFGGILLGTSGLSRAYYSCANNLIKNSKIIENYVRTHISFNCNYKEYNRIVYSKLFDVYNAEFSNSVKVEFSVKNSQMDEFKIKMENLLSRKISFF